MRDGTIDLIATDHAPHHYDEKEREFADAPNGIIGLETALAVNITWLVAPGIIDVPLLVERMSCAPARVFKLPGGTLRRGAPADVTVFDPTANGWWIRRGSGRRGATRRTPAKRFRAVRAYTHRRRPHGPSSTGRDDRRTTQASCRGAAIVRVCRRLYERGLVAGPDGNVSVRLADGIDSRDPARAVEGGCDGG